MVPQTNREYPVTWQVHAFRVTFSAAFCAYGAQVDLARGALVLGDGSRQDLLGARRSFEAATGSVAPPCFMAMCTPKPGFTRIMRRW